MFLNRNNLQLDTDSIVFVIRASFYDYTSGKTEQKKTEELDDQKLFLLSNFCKKDFYENMPKTFTISTKNTTLHFNLLMLKDTSPVISKYIQNNPDENNYTLNITDDENTLAKIEKLYQGKNVFFTENEIPIIQQFTQLLQIKCFPNYLKPNDLATNEFDSDGVSFRTLRTVSRVNQFIHAGVQIYKNYFANFLRKDEYKVFKIFTKKTEYKCSIFGVYTSNIIRQILLKDPSIEEFSFDFEDNENEFQQICDFFNCEKVGITISNVNSLKEIAEKLEINCILQSIDNYINNYDLLTQKIDEQEKIIDSIDELFDLLCNIKNIGIEKVKVSIVQSKWSQKERYVEELAAFILQVIKPSYSLQKEIAELLIELDKESNDQNKLNILIPFIIKRLITLYWPKKSQNIDDQKNDNANKNTSFGLNPNSEGINVYKTQEKINLTNRCVYSFIRILYKRGLIRKEEIFERLKDYDLSSNLINAFFLPELVEINPKNFEYIINIDKKDIRYSLGKIDELKLDIKNYGFCYFLPKVAKQYFPDKIDLYAKMLDKMESDDEISKSIHIDDVDTLQNLIFRNKIDTNNYRVSYNIFDDFEEELNLINYTAFCGSVKCFKYLLLNNNEICDTTFYYAVYGGNNEIIKIVDQQSTNAIVNTNNNAIGNRSLCYMNLYRDSSFFSFWFDFYGIDIRKKKFGFIYNDPIKYDKYNDNNIQYSNNHNHVFYFMPNCVNINNIIAPTIVMHKNDLFDWIFENKFINKGRNGNSLEHIVILSASTGNIHSLIALIDNNFSITKNIISLTARNGFYKLTQFLLDLYDKKASNDPKSSGSDDSFDYKSIVHFGNLSIFKLFIKYMNQADLEQSFLHAIEIDCTIIIEYIFDHQSKFNFSIDNKDFIRNALNLSINANASMFDLLIGQFKKLKPELFNLNLFTNLLNRACLYSNLTTTEKITDIILKENPKYDFTKAFINASSSKSTNICQYLIDKKVQVDFTRSENISNLGKLDIELFEKIINNVDPNLKFMFYDSIHVAIKNKNIQVIEFILKENPPKGFELFEAVKTNDIEVVDVILKYNSQPSFINRMMNNVTALYHAVKNKNIEIIKRLLSVPGIDPSIINAFTGDVLIIAVQSSDIEVLDAILNYYENSHDNIPATPFVKSIIHLGSCPYVNDLTQNYWDIIQRFIRIKPIDPKCWKFDLTSWMSKSFLIPASFHNKIDIVKDLLNLPNINVNIFDDSTNNTPLLISFELKNLEIVKLLINHPKTNINFANNRFESALVIAVKYDQKEIIEMLLNDKRFDAEESQLNYAFIFSKYEISKRLYSLSCLDVNQSLSITRNERKYTINALKHSVNINDVDKLDLIIKHPSFNIYKSNICMSIFISAKRNNIEIFRKLIKLINNDVNIHNDRGMSLLSYAAINLSGEIVDEILNNEHFDSKDPEICYAFTSSYSKMIIENNQPQQQQPRRFGQGSLKNILKQRNILPIYEMNNDVLNQELIPDKISMIEMMEKLINYDNEHEHLIKFDKLLPNGESFFTTIVNDYPDIDTICDFLIEHGVDPNMSNSNGIYPLEHAIRINSVKLVTSLVNSEKINYSQLRNGITYLHLAAKNKDSSILSFLLQKNIIDINSVNFIGETPFMTACKSGNIENINLLFRNNNNDYLHRNKDGKDALDLFITLPPEKNEEIKQNKDKFYDLLISIINQMKSF